MAGVAVRGDSLLGAFGREGQEGIAGSGKEGIAGIALWSLPLPCLSSVADAPGGGVLLSSAGPAGHVTLTGISAGEIAGMIGRARESCPPAGNAR